MNADFAKIILGNIFRSLLTVAITFFVTKQVIEADVASKLMRGDTIPLWNGAINLNMAMFVNVLVGLALPILFPLALGIYSRVEAAYATIVARSEAFQMSKKQLKEEVSKASITEIIKTVAVKP